MFFEINRDNLCHDERCCYKLTGTPDNKGDLTFSVNVPALWEEYDKLLKNLANEYALKLFRVQQDVNSEYKALRKKLLKEYWIKHDKEKKQAKVRKV